MQFPQLVGNRLGLRNSCKFKILTQPTFIFRLITTHLHSEKTAFSGIFKLICEHSRALDDAWTLCAEWSRSSYNFLYFFPANASHMCEETWIHFQQTTFVCFAAMNFFLRMECACTFGLKSIQMADSKCRVYCQHASTLHHSSARDFVAGSNHFNF